MSGVGRRPGWRARCAGESGSGSLLVALGCVLLAVVAAAAAALGSVLVVRTQVAAAADLGSIAAASASVTSAGDACARARSVVRANGAVLSSCQVTGAGARVEVVATAPPAVAWLTGGRTAHLRARAHAELVPPEDLRGHP